MPDTNTAKETGGETATGETAESESRPFKTVWAVTYSDWDEYDIRGVFTSETEAEKARVALDGKTWAHSIEEWIVYDTIEDWQLTEHQIDADAIANGHWRDGKLQTWQAPKDTEEGKQDQAS